MKDGDSPVVAATTTWRVRLGEAPAIRCWDEEYVVYNPATGSTHLLDIVAGEVIKRIAAGPATTADLCRHIAGLLDLPDDDTTAAHVTMVLAALERLELVESTPA